MGMRSILLLRHGPADQSAPDAFIGRTNPALTEQGREIAKAAGRRLSHLQIGGVYTSPLIRCVQTGRLLGLENLPVETVEGLGRAEAVRSAAGTKRRGRNLPHPTARRRRGRASARSIPASSTRTTICWIRPTTSR